MAHEFSLPDKVNPTIGTLNSGNDLCSFIFNPSPNPAYPLPICFNCYSVILLVLLHSFLFICFEKFEVYCKVLEFSLFSCVIQSVVLFILFMSVHISNDSDV